MGWHPDQVRSLSLSDLMAAFEGWQMAHGIQPASAMEQALEELEELMERYPDG